MKTSELTGAMLDYWVARAELAATLDGMVIKPVAKDQWTINCQDDGSIGGYICGGTMEGIKLRRTLNLRHGEWHYRPSCDWSFGGPIIERERIAVLCPRTGDFFDARDTKLGQIPATYWRGETYLIAAMRAYVDSKFGDEVEAIPAAKGAEE